MADMPNSAENGPGAQWAALNVAGQQALRQGHWDEAVQQYQTALRIAEHSGSMDEQIITSLWELGSACHAKKEHREGEQLRRRALALQEVRLGPDHPQVADLLSFLAYDCSNMGQPMEGVSLLERACSIYEQAGGPEHTKVGECLSGLAMLSYNAGQLTIAEDYLQRSLALSRQHPDAAPHVVANNCRLLAHVYARQDKLKEAEQLYRDALQTTEQVEGPAGFGVGQAAEEIAAFYARRLHNFGAAEQLYRRALSIYEQCPGPDCNTALLCRHTLAAMCHSQGRYQEAEALLQYNITLHEQAQVPEHFAVPHRLNLANNLSLLAHFYTEAGRYAEAEPLLQRALTIKEEGLGPEHVHVAWLLEQYGRFLQATGRKAESREVEARMQAILAKSDYRGSCGIRPPTAGSPPTA